MAARAALPQERHLDRLAAALMAMPEDERRSYLLSLDPTDVAVCEQALGRRVELGWRETPATMGHHLAPEQMELYPYVELLGRKFVEAVDGTDPFQIWNLPAQYGKSTLMHWGLAWALDRAPSQRFITTSYGDDLATENGTATRQLLTDHAGLLNPKAQLRQNQRRKNRWRTQAGGGLLARGMGGGITGFGAHGIVVDDPFKNWQEAHSPARRKLVWDWYRSVLWLRRTTDTAWIIVVMTRWHEDDLAGKLLKEADGKGGTPFTLVRLPEVAEPAQPDASDPAVRAPDPLGREPGQVLEPRRFSAEDVALKHRTLGSYLTAGMAQQRPAPEEGGELKRAWWQLSAVTPTQADQWVASWDVKQKDKQGGGDYVAGAVMARTGSSFWVLDMLRGQWNQATTANAIALASVRWPQVTVHVVENTGNGPEVMEQLRGALPDYVVSDEMAGALGMTVTEREQVQALRRRGMPGIVPSQPKGTKQQRARAFEGLVEAGDVRLPESAQWVPAFLDETAAFPNGTHDDQVDAWSQGMKRLAQGSGTIEQPNRTRTATPPPPAARVVARGSALRDQTRRRL